MKRVIQTEKHPIKLWLDDMEPGALQQARNLANHPFTQDWVAIMPDSHQGYGMPIGGVLATRDVIIPNAVGVDIGCGMCAVRTSLAEVDTPTLKQIMRDIRQAVPVGFAHHPQQQDERLMPARDQELPIVAREYQSALRQIGTLGGGNHFIELQKGNDGRLWVMIHSGSRNIGKQVADHYNKLAVALNEKRKDAVPKEWELAYLPLDTEEGRRYLGEMKYCVEFALANRKLMMDRILEILAATPGLAPAFDPMINIAHNYAALEEHNHRPVMVHRKGATLATRGLTGIIPGSQGTKSYIVTGKGNPDSFQSCSHGAGRKMGRNQAIRSLSLADEKRKLDERGILHAIRSAKDLDEASGAYKDIDVVMQNQEDLVDIAVELQPLAVIKG